MGASKIESQASKIQTQIENMSSKRFSSLSSTSHREPLSSEESIKMFKSFQSIDRRLDPSDNTSNEHKLTHTDQLILDDITTLTNIESTCANTKSDAQLLDDQVSNAKYDVDMAVKTHTQAQQRLDEAKKELAEAKDAVRLRKKSLVEKEGEKSRAGEKVRRVTGSLESQMEKMRTKLRRREDSALEKEVSWMEDERNRLEEEANVLWGEALTFGKKLEEICRISYEEL